VTSTILPKSEQPARPPLSELPGAVLQYTDVLIWRLAKSTEEFARTVGTPEAHLQAVEWRLEGTRTATQIATGPMPTVGLLQILASVTAARINHRDHWMEVWGEPNRPILMALEESERDGWALAQLFLDEAQIGDVRKLIEEWATRSRDEDAGLIGRLSVTDMTAALKTGTSGSRGKLLGFLQLDPLASLEPAARELAMTRLTVERTLFWAERVPLLVQDQLELVLMRLRTQPEVVRILEDVRQTSESLAEVSATVTRLPEELRAEREAAVRQVSEELTVQRQGLVEDLATAREPLESLLQESRSTFGAADTMAGEVAEAVRALDTFVGRFEGEGDGAQVQPSAAAAAEEAPSRPFDITEYGAAAERIGVAAAELRTLVQELDTSLPRVEGLVADAVQRGEEAIDHAFRRGLLGGLVLIAAAAGAALLVRRMARG
jgi:hypothetical protein